MAIPDVGDDLGLWIAVLQESDLSLQVVSLLVRTDTGVADELGRLLASHVRINVMASLARLGAIVRNLAGVGIPSHDPEMYP